jgi:uncharacterized protein (TIGR03435 family)
MIRNFTFASVVLLASITFAGPQPLASARPEFDVASIKPNKSDERMDYGGVGNGLSGRNISLQGWIQIAYEVRDFQVSGPSWIANEKFDIEARAEGEPTIQQTLLMLQSLLADRFHLTLHRETKESSIYTLDIHGRGLTMKASADQSLWAGDFPNGSPDGRPVTGGGPTGLGPGRFRGEAIPMTLFIRLLAGPLGRTVVNRTGLTGRYDIDLRYAPGSGLAAFSDSAPAGETSDPSLFTALQEQLGLKLESTRGPVEMLVIDRVELPSEN